MIVEIPASGIVRHLPVIDEQAAGDDGVLTVQFRSARPLPPIVPMNVRLPLLKYIGVVPTLVTVVETPAAPLVTLTSPYD